MVLGYLFSYGYVLLVLLTAVAAGKFGLLGQEGRRKWIHIMLIFTWLIMIRYLKGTIHMIIIPATFVVLNLLSYLSAKKTDGGSIPILSTMERGGEEETPGTVYYALSIMIMAGLTLINETFLLPCGIGMFCMAFGDGMAGVIGKFASGVFAKRITRDKSIGGSLGCFVFSIIGCVILMLCMGQDLYLGKLVLIGLGCSVLELPDHGIDNLTVPFGCMGIAYFLFN